MVAEDGWYGAFSRAAGRVVSLAGMILAVVSLSACDATNQASGPGALRFLDGEPNFVVCTPGLFAEIFVTTRADGKSTVIWRAKGEFEIAEQQEVDRGDIEPISADFEENPVPEMHSGDSVSIALVAANGEDSTGVVYLVTREALEGRWVDASGAAREPSCTT